MKRFIFLILLSSSVYLYAETIVSPVAAVISLPVESGSEKNTKLKLEESVVLDIQGNKEFLKSLTLEMHQSNTLKRYADSFEIILFKRLKPLPAKGLKNFKGIRIFSHIIPYQNRIYVRIPVQTDKKAGRGSRENIFSVKKPVSISDFPLLITIQPVMKGIPDKAFTKEFYISAAPEVINRGFLELSIKKPEDFKNEQYSVFIDGKEVNNKNKPVELDAGIHELLIQSASFEKVTSAFTIEAGKTNSMNIILKQNISTISFEAPENAVVYLDGTKLAPYQLKRIRIKGGEHLIRIKIDDYSLTRKVTVKKNKTYKVSLVFDMLIKEY
ncbi:MAG: PEGA domain-containing protein [Spirochaetes bacterium]|nr:PEGA domain-containing protein [Spirochaetota bacterium]